MKKSIANNHNPWVTSETKFFFVKTITGVSTSSDSVNAMSMHKLTRIISCWTVIISEESVRKNERKDEGLFIIKCRSLKRKPGSDMIKV